MAEENNGSGATPPNGGAQGQGAQGQDGQGQQGQGAQGQGAQGQQQGKQGQGDDWRTGIADPEVRKLADRYTTREAWDKAHVDLNKELSQRIKVPGKDASEEDHAKFRKALGVPDTIEEYAIARPEHLSEEVFKSPQVQTTLNSIVGEMHKAGASKAVVDAAMAAYWKIEAAGQAAIADNDKRSLEAAQAALRTEWKGDYDMNMGFAKEFCDTNPEVAQLELKDGTLLGSNPFFAKMAANAGRLLSEGVLQHGIKGSEAGVDMQAKYDKLSEDISVAYAKGDSVTARRLDAERSKISEQLHGVASIR